MSEPSQHAIDAANDIAENSAAWNNRGPANRIQQAIDAATINLRAFISEQDSVIQEQTNRADKAERENEELRSLNQLARTLMHKEKESAEKAEAACAEMKQVIYNSRLSAAYMTVINKEDHEAIDKALSSDCGRNHVPMDDVRPLLEHLADHATCDKCAQTYNNFLAKHGGKLKPTP